MCSYELIAEVCWEPVSNCKVELDYLSDRVTAQLQPDPIYFPTVTSNSVWPSKMYAIKVGIASQGICSTLCSIDISACELYVHEVATTTCYLGKIGNSLTKFTSKNAAGTETMYTRISK